MDEQKMAGKCESGMCGMCATCMTGKGSGCSPMHWSCCIVPLLSMIFWIGGIASLVLAWSAADGVAWNRPDAFWYLNALALGVLAIGGRGKKFGFHRKGCCGSGMCKDGCAGGACSSCK